MANHFRWMHLKTSDWMSSRQTSISIHLGNTTNLPSLKCKSCWNVFLFLNFRTVLSARCSFRCPRLPGFSYKLDRNNISLWYPKTFCLHFVLLSFGMYNKEWILNSCCSFPVLPEERLMIPSCLRLFVWQLSTICFSIIRYSVCVT